MAELFKNCPGWEGRAGGYFCLADADNGLPLVVTLIGTITVSVERARRHFSVCVEQARQLATYPQGFEGSDPNIRVSGQLDEELAWDQRPGAVRDAIFVYSFSGLPKPGNELAMLGAIQLCRPEGPHRDLDQIAESYGIMEYWERLTQLLTS